MKEKSIFAGKFYISFSTSLLSSLVIKEGNDIDILKWVNANNLRDWYNEFRESYFIAFPDSSLSGFDHDFGTIILNAKHDKVMSYGGLVSTYYHNNTIPNLLEIHILRKGKYD